MKKFILGGVAGFAAAFILMMALGVVTHRRSAAEMAALPPERAFRLQQAQVIGAAYALYPWQHHGFSPDSLEELQVSVTGALVDTSWLTLRVRRKILPSPVSEVLVAVERTPDASGKSVCIYGDGQATLRVLSLD
jgi:hypothetical protein